MDYDAVIECLDGVFREIGLLIGGVCHDIEDPVVWKLTKGVESIRERAHERIEFFETPLPTGILSRIRTQAHPAVEALLQVIEMDSRAVPA